MPQFRAPSPVSRYGQEQDRADDTGSGIMLAQCYARIGGKRFGTGEDWMIEVLVIA